ncbi:MULTISPECIES: MBOAT family O-acyltransferase [Clostridium]|jgi:alginate O-acetyltransferase complex protein AlgI|uniref:MBOAT family O-acyltransferase n=1 Tax=Clostridium TaxID=1485 RepID=UPI00241D74E9|nr:MULTISPECIES: MBOAT family O-acyltransferase [Clostridium]MBS6501034.1 MBOAT family protein [Clostridium sp.]MDU3525443.1 MBOAT family O-acyltransferase [Clostridium sp.]MDU7363129.1 MBOAT family O-acyltransferase [Clostridium sp.]
MLFSSSVFIFIFLPLVLFLYYISGKKIRNYILLLASLIFYAWGGVNYLKILMVSILINYIFGLLIDKTVDRSHLRKFILILGIILNLALLFYYKYYDFFIENINNILNMNLELKRIVLPIGISFFTFQGMSYIIDIYRNDGKVNKNIFSVALYISFFPQLVAGPIIKYKIIDEQIRVRKESIDYFSYGINRFVIGLGKKIIISDMLGAISDNIFLLANSSGIDMITAWIGAICYTLQIYFDFSGYSDMAIGLGHLFGFKFPENFNYPYISRSITEFWRRWHISLSTWFKEYLYIPLGGNRRGNVYFNLFVVFLVTGLWHGASWNFVIWGLWHGMFMIIERVIRNENWYKKIPSFIKIFITLFIVIIGWVLFKATTLEEGLKYLSIMFGLSNFSNITFEYTYFISRKFIVLIIIGIMASTPIFKKIFNRYRGIKVFELIKTLLIILLFIISIIFMVNSTYSPFIYFQF